MYSHKDKTLERTAFVRLVAEAGLVMRELGTADLDFIFLKVRRNQRLTYEQFLVALRLIALKLDCSEQTIFQVVATSPIAHKIINKLQQDVVPSPTS